MANFLSDISPEWGENINLDHHSDIPQERYGSINDRRKMLRLCNENITEFEISWYIQEVKGALIEKIRRGNTTVGPGGGRSLASPDQVKVHDEIDYFEEQVTKHNAMKKLLRSKQ
jgi:hypothetical protein